MENDNNAINIRVLNKRSLKLLGCSINAVATLAEFTEGVCFFEE